MRFVLVSMLFAQPTRSLKVTFLLFHVRLVEFRNRTRNTVALQTDKEQLFKKTNIFNHLKNFVKRNEKKSLDFVRKDLKGGKTHSVSEI